MNTYQLQSINNTYEVTNFLRSDKKYNVYVSRTSNLTGVYKGESAFCIGVTEPYLGLTIEDVTSLVYEL